MGNHSKTINKSMVYGHKFTIYIGVLFHPRNGYKWPNSKTWQIATPRKCKHGTMIQMMFRPYFQVFNGSFFEGCYLIIYNYTYWPIQKMRPGPRLRSLTQQFLALVNGDQTYGLWTNLAILMKNVPPVIKHSNYMSPLSN